MHFINRQRTYVNGIPYRLEPRGTLSESNYARNNKIHYHVCFS
ncbi:hypothetical protein SAMN05444166_1378 [Singulisphaera sp. GP187]|nr:hypothetical protein SAMN05444166_1378 [Singulisphaera sp. GP187]